ncbi:MAG: amidohydrolase family protein [Proteobacteria bacterium]|nr:amidohydrolase family protein [Pseudomonadota bacterium]
MTRSVLVTALLLACSPLLAANVLLTNAVVYDGTGNEPFRGDVRIEGERIAAVAPQLTPRAGETVLDQRGLSLAPGFIDMHSHGSRGLTEDLDAATVSLQGITTILVGQDGESNFPLRDYFAQFDAGRPAINVASMVGHATLREQVMGKDLYRASTPQELAQMKTLLARELTAGAFGLSTGLEYEAAHFATTEEVIDLARGRGRRQGLLHQPRPRRSESDLRLVRGSAAHRPRSAAPGRDYPHQDGLDVGLAPGCEAHAGIVRARAAGRRRSQGRRLSLHVLALHDSRDRARP